MDPIKESFKRVKEDIDFLKVEVNQIRESIIELCEIIEKVSKREQKIEQTSSSTEQIPIISSPADTFENPTIQQIIPAHNTPFRPLNHQKQPFSTGNEGVPADRQTDQQTDKHIEKTREYAPKTQRFPFENQEYQGNSIENAAEMLKSLDNIKRDIRQKFKKLTDQEWLVFSTIYQLDEETGSSDYRLIAEKLHLTESSIRDYVARLIKKGIPVDKTKLNNKNIQLNISQNLKRIASLPTILTLREL